MDKNTVRLLKQIGRAELALNQAKKGHSERCIVELDPDGMAPCNCGASATNAAIDKALKELQVD